MAKLWQKEFIAFTLVILGQIILIFIFMNYFRVWIIQETPGGTNFVVGAFLVMSLLIAGIVSFVFSKYLVNQLNEIKKGIKIRENNFEFNIEPVSTDEFSEIGLHLNNFGKDLKLLVEKFSSEANDLRKKIDEKDEEYKKGFEELESARKALINILDDVDKSRKELSKALVELKQVDKSKSSFLRNVTHEFKTPLTVMQLNIERLMRMPLPPKAKEILPRLFRGTQRFMETVTSVLHLSRMEAGIIHYNREKIDVTKIIKEQAYNLKLLAEKKGIYFKINIGKKIPFIYGDKEHLSEIFRNLMINGLKFTDTGGITVEVITVKENVLISVEDTGIGIPKEFHSKIFSKFFQVDSSTARVHPGSGIGLSIVKEAVRAHSGKVWFESKSGKGTKFFIELPPYSKAKKQFAKKSK